MPGMIERNGAARSTARPSAIMPPQVTRFGSPRPRKESAASIRMAPATITEHSASTGGRALGRISRKAISTGCMPIDAGSGDEIALADGEHFGARNPRRSGPGAERDGATTTGSDGPSDADEGQRQQKARHGLEGIGQAHQNVVDEAAREAGRGADKAPTTIARGRRGKPDSKRRARAMEQAGQHIAAEAVRAQRMRRSRENGCISGRPGD